MLPGCSVIWSSILPRRSWRYSNNDHAKEITRIRSYILKYGGYVVKYPDFDDRHPGLFLDVGYICHSLETTFFSTSCNLHLSHLLNIHTVLYSHMINYWIFCFNESIMLNWKFCCWWLLWLWIVMGKFCGRLSFSSTDQNDNLAKFTWSLRCYRSPSSYLWH